MLVALDYDDTYTRDPDLWNAVVKAFRMRGHQVIVVTMRSSQEGTVVIAALEDKVDAIHFTCRKAKRNYLLERGINVDVWIDDSPWFILMDAKEAEDDERSES